MLGKERSGLELGCEKYNMLCGGDFRYVLGVEWIKQFFFQKDNFYGNEKNGLNGSYSFVLRLQQLLS